MLGVVLAMLEAVSEDQLEEGLRVVGCSAGGVAGLVTRKMGASFLLSDGLCIGRGDLGKETFDNPEAESFVLSGTVFNGELETGESTSSGIEIVGELFADAGTGFLLILKTSFGGAGSGFSPDVASDLKLDPDELGRTSAPLGKGFLFTE